MNEDTQAAELDITIQARPLPSFRSFHPNFSPVTAPTNQPLKTTAAPFTTPSLPI